MSRVGLGAGSVDRHLAHAAERSSLRGVHVDVLMERLSDLDAEPRFSRGRIRCKTVCHNGAGAGDSNLVLFPTDDGNWAAKCFSLSCSYHEIVTTILSRGPLPRVDGAIASDIDIAAASRERMVGRPEPFDQDEWNKLRQQHLDLLAHRFAKPEKYGGYESLVAYLEEERVISLDVLKSEMIGWARTELRVTIPYRLPPALARGPKEFGQVYQLDRWQPRFWRREGRPKILAEPDRDRWLYYPLPKLLVDGEAYLCEGAMDALACVSCGLPAIGSPASGAWYTPWSEELVKLGVKLLHVLPDNDRAGRKFALLVRRRLRTDAPDIKVDIKSLVDVPQGGDLVDYLRGQR